MEPALDSRGAVDVVQPDQVALQLAADPLPAELTDREPAVDASAAPWGLFRPAEAADLPLVLESWTGTWKLSDWAGTVQNHLFDAAHHATILALLRRGARVLCLANPERPDQVLAWLCYELKPTEVVVHYLFTKAPFRRRGLARSLLEHVGAGSGRFVYTHRTAAARYWPRAKHVKAIAARKEV